MSNHFIAIKRGKDGFANSDFTFGTATSAATDIELRIADVDGGGVVMTDKDVVLALEAFKRVIMQPLDNNFPPL